MKVRIVERVAAGYCYIKMIKPCQTHLVGNFYKFNSNIVHRYPLV